MEDFDFAEATNEAVLRSQLDTLKAKYFRELSALKLEIKDGLKAPAQLVTASATIQIDRRVSTFQEKTTKLLILHELIHFSLFKENGDPYEKEGKRFKDEVDKLWDAGHTETFSNFWVEFLGL